MKVCSVCGGCEVPLEAVRHELVVPIKGLRRRDVQRAIKALQRICIGEPLVGDFAQMNGARSVLEGIKAFLPIGDSEL
jgi:hypothetical protein